MSRALSGAWWLTKAFVLTVISVMGFILLGALMLLYRTPGIGRFLTGPPH